MVTPDGVAVLGADEVSNPQQLARHQRRSIGMSQQPLGQTVVVRPLDELESAWQRDLYNLFWD